MGEPVDLYADARFTAEISSRMQVPERLMVNEGASSNTNQHQHQGFNGYSPESPTHSTVSGRSTTSSSRFTNDLGMHQRDPRLDMQVPDRIIVAGGNSHIASKSTPREMQMDAAVLPPTLDHVRVSTPPRSIRLDEHAFPSATDQESNGTGSTFDADGRRMDEVNEDTPLRRRAAKQAQREMNRSVTRQSTEGSDPQLKDSTSLALLSDAGRDNLSPYEEIQLVRRQMAKLNHRLMAVELENQQQQQREMILTVVLSAFFLGKVILWVNRSL